MHQEMTFSTLDWVELVETRGVYAGAQSGITFSTLDWVELVETFLALGLALARRRLSVPSIGSNWLKPGAAGADDPGGVLSVPSIGSNWLKRCGLPDTATDRTTFSTLDWVELVETPNPNKPQSYRNALSVPSIGSNWLKQQANQRPSNLQRTFSTLDWVELVETRLR